jgi:subtilisin
VVESLSASEVETSDEDAEFDVSWSVSDVDGDLAAVDLTLIDDDDGSTEDTVSVSVDGSSASGTTRLVATGDDGTARSYTIEVVVTDATGATTSDTTTVTESESGSDGRAPEIDTFALTDASAGPWAKVTVDWTVSDADGDLAGVDLDLVDSSGTVVDSLSASISGASATGTDRLREKGSGEYDVVLTVTDATGATTTASRSITLG